MGASEYQALQSGIDALSSKVDVWGRRRNLGQAPGTSAHNEALKDRVEHRYPQQQYPSKSKDAEADALKARVDQLTKKLDEANAERKRARKEATKEAKQRQKAETSALEERISAATLNAPSQPPEWWHGPATSHQPPRPEVVRRRILAAHPGKGRGGDQLPSTVWPVGVPKLDAIITRGAIAVVIGKRWPVRWKGGRDSAPNVGASNGV